MFKAMRKKTKLNYSAFMQRRKRKAQITTAARIVGAVAVQFDWGEGNPWEVCKMRGNVLSPDLKVVTRVYILQFIHLFVLVSEFI